MSSSSASDSLLALPLLSRLSYSEQMDALEEAQKTLQERESRALRNYRIDDYKTVDEIDASYVDRFPVSSLYTDFSRISEVWVPPPPHRKSSITEPLRLFSLDRKDDVLTAECREGSDGLLWRWMMAPGWLDVTGYGPRALYFHTGRKKTSWMDPSILNRLFFFGMPAICKVHGSTRDIQKEAMAAVDDATGLIPDLAKIVISYLMVDATPDKLIMLVDPPKPVPVEEEHLHPDPEKEDERPTKRTKA